QGVRRVALDEGGAGAHDAADAGEVPGGDEAAALVHVAAEDEAVAPDAGPRRPRHRVPPPRPAAPPPLPRAGAGTPRRQPGWQCAHVRRPAAAARGGLVLLCLMERGSTTDKRRAAERCHKKGTTKATKHTKEEPRPTPGLTPARVSAADRAVAILLFFFSCVS